MTQTFPNWTEYDEWLIANYDKYNITELNENENHEVVAVYEDKPQG